MGASYWKAQIDGLQKYAIYRVMKVAYDELPGVSASRMRASGEITAEMKVANVWFGERSFNVALWLMKFKNGGSWSYFVCSCGRRARILRLFEGGLACRGCLKARGLRARVELVRTEKRAAYHAPRILARLNSDKPARLHPRPGRTLDRRTKLEIALKRSLIVARKAKIEQFEKDLDKP